MSRILEQLETRTMMAGDFNLLPLDPIIYIPIPTPLVIDGTAGNDNIFLSRDGLGNLNVTKNGVATSYAEWLVSKVVVNAGDGNDQVYTSSSNFIKPVEINGGNGNDYLYGGPQADTVTGGGGNDFIWGAGGNDNLDGGVGGVAVYGDNTGTDSVYGCDGDDVLNASDYGNCVLVGGNGSDILYGWQGNNTLYGDWGNDCIYGYTGNDTVYGSYGNDYISTGGGADVIYGDADNDTVYAGAGNDILHGNSGDDYLFGQDGDDKVYGDAGCDVLSGGNGNDTLVSIGGGQNDCLYGDAGYDSFWADSEGTENIWDADFAEIVNGHVHRVSGFMSYTYHNGSIWPWDWTSVGVTRDLNGQNFVDPINGANYQNFSNRPLFSTGGPSKDDIDQGGLGDCYFMASLGSVAKANPDRIRQHVVELGDGTYAVQFSNTYIRVDGDLPTNGAGSLSYAGLGLGNSVWTAVMEKAFAYYRHGDSDYSSIEGGWMDEGYSAMGVGTSTLDVNGWYKFWNNSNDLWNYVNGELAAGKAVTIGTPGGSPDLVGSHAYMVDRVYTDGWGTKHVVLRNPWGNAGNPGAYVDITASQLYNSISRVQSAFV
jgi:Ca2+-binding RTX toxin-like protein